jgi:hypothetical protein
LEVEREKCAKVSEGVRVDKLRRDSSFVILWEQTQEKARAGLKKLWSGRNPQGGESTARIRRIDSRNPADRQIWEKLRGI